MAGRVLTGLGTPSRPLVKTIVEMHMETEVQAVIRVATSKRDGTHLVLDTCSSGHGSLRIRLLHK